MSGSLLRASWRVVGRPPALICVGVAVLVTIAAVPLVDSGHADQVRIGVATLLACALAATAEDPASEVTAATPHPRWVRCGTRLLLGLAMALPIAILTLVMTEVQDAAMPTRAAGFQMLTVLLTGPAVGFGVWAWATLRSPPTPRWSASSASRSRSGSCRPPGRSSSSSLGPAAGRRPDPLRGPDLARVRRGGHGLARPRGWWPISRRPY